MFPVSQMQNAAAQQSALSLLAFTRLGQLRRLTIFLGAAHQLENMKFARIMKNGVD
jgi:hypothetical protein